MMEMQDVISEIRLELTGNLLDMEVEDKTLQDVVNKALREVGRFWDETAMITVPFASCIDMSKFDYVSVVKVYRTEGYGENGDKEDQNISDPMYAQQWMTFSNGGSMYNLNDYILNYAAWNTLLKIKNTMSTDMSFKEDLHDKKLYINRGMNAPRNITIEYIPKLRNVEDIKSDYWLDILIRMSTALTKIVLGRIRTRFVQSNALWSMDGDKLLDEGNTDLKELRETLRTNSSIIYPLD